MCESSPPAVSQGGFGNLMKGSDHGDFGPVAPKCTEDYGGVHGTQARTGDQSRHTLQFALSKLQKGVTNPQVLCDCPTLVGV